MAIVIGTDGNDRYNDPAYPNNVELKGTNLADQIYGLAGDDELVGFDGDDLLEGGRGADVLWGQYGLCRVCADQVTRALVGSQR